MKELTAKNAKKDFGTFSDSRNELFLRRVLWIQERFLKSTEYLNC